MPSWFYLSLRSEAGYSQIPTFHFPSPLSVYHALKTRMQTDRHNVRKITLKLSEQIIFIRKNKATKLIYFNRCPSQPAGNKPTGTWVIATCRSVLHEDICHYLYWTQVYINYILAGRQPTVRLPGKHLYNCLIHKDSKKITEACSSPSSLLFILILQLHAGKAIGNLDALRNSLQDSSNTGVWPNTVRYLLPQNFQAQYFIFKLNWNSFARSETGLYTRRHENF